MNIIYKQRKSKFIHEFQHQSPDVICPTFHVFSCGHRCSFNPPCSYCFLNLTFRYENEPIVYQSLKVLDEVKEWLLSTKTPSVLNAGELCDSFMVQQNKLLADVMDLFETQDKHKLLFLTKNDKIPTEIEENIYAKPYKQTVFSFSVNSAKASKLYEIGAPNPFERLACAYKLKKNGQCVRIRIDPITPLDNYREEYRPIVAVLNEFLKPERITLGSLRYFKNLPNFAKNKEVFKYGVDQNDGDNRLRLPLEKRTEIYKWFLDNLQCADIALCKETLKCYKVLNLKTNLKCNCML